MIPCRNSPLQGNAGVSGVVSGEEMRRSHMISLQYNTVFVTQHYIHNPRIPSQITRAIKIHGNGSILFSLPLKMSPSPDWLTLETDQMIMIGETPMDSLNNIIHHLGGAMPRATPYIPSRYMTSKSPTFYLILRVKKNTFSLLVSSPCCLSSSFSQHCPQWLL